MSEISARWPGLQPMDTAPHDGTVILIRFEHPNYVYAIRAGDIEDAKRWEALTEAHWINFNGGDFNGGGWTWYGMMGRTTGWMPKP